MNKLALFLGVIVLSGCASQYTPPKDGAQAKLRIDVTGNDYFALLHTYENQTTCKGPQFISMLGGEKFVKANEKNNAFIGMMGGNGKVDSHKTEIAIPAKNLFTIRYGQIGPHSGVITRSCEISASFTPEEASEYELTYFYDGKACYLTAFKLQSSPDGIVSKTQIFDLEKNPSKCLATTF